MSQEAMSQEGSRSRWPHRFGVDDLNDIGRAGLGLDT